jgi:hypothetical protein
MRVLRALVALTAALAVGVLTPAAVQAQKANQTPNQPVATVSIAPVERLTQDFTYLTRLVGVPQIGGIGTMMTKQYTQGLDASRPAGLVVQMIDSQPLPLAFLPLTNRQQFFDALAGAGMIPDELGSGLYSFDANGQTIYAKEAGNWLFVSQQENGFNNLPADPSVLLGDLPKKYSIALRLNVQALPADLRDMAAAQLRTGFERRLAEQDNQTEEEKAAAKEIGEATIKQMERLLKETEQVMIGWNATAASQKLQIDVAAQFVEGSELAGEVAKLQGLTSDFTGLLINGATMTLRSTSVISDGDKALLKNNVRTIYGQLEKKIDDDGSMPSTNKEALKKFAHGLMDVLEQTIDNGKLDGGGALALSDGKVRGVFGGLVANGLQLEKQIKDLVASLGSDDDVPTFQFNYAKHQNVNLHKVTIPIKSDDPNVKKVFGDELIVVLGTGEKVFLVSVDPDGDRVIKAALDRLASAKNVKVNPGEFIAQVSQILAFAQTLTQNPILDTATQTMQQSQGKDYIRVLNTLVTRGLMVQIVVDEGVLKGIGAVVQASQNGGGAGF